MVKLVQVIYIFGKFSTVSTYGKYQWLRIKVETFPLKKAFSILKIEGLSWLLNMDLLTFPLCFQTLDKVFWAHTWNFRLYSLVTEILTFPSEVRKRPQVCGPSCGGGLIVNRIKFSASFQFDPDGRFSKSHTGLQDCFLIISYILCFIENIHSFWHLESLLFLQVVYWALNTRRYLFRHVSTGKYE